jgi:hypothetical protein
MVHGNFAKQKPTFDQLLNKYTNQKVVPRDRPLKKRPRSPPCQNKPSSPRGESSKRKCDVTTLFPPQKVYATMPCAPPPSDSSCPTWEHEGIWMQRYPMPHPPSHQSEEDHRRPMFDRLSQPVHDRVGSHQSGPRQQPALVRPVLPGARSFSLSKIGISCKGEEGRGAAHAAGLRKNYS